MPTIVYQINPKTGVKYAYESTSYWDKDKKAPRSTRKYLGRVDPETGEIIPKAGRQGSPDGQPRGTHGNGDAPDGRDAEIADLKARLAEMTARYEEAARRLREIADLAGG